MEQIAITAQYLNDLHAPLQYCIFDENGGTIGSDSTNSFCLEDSQLQGQHINIQYEEGCFTIASIGESAIFYNESFSKLHAGYETTMELGDTFKAGHYRFSVIDPKDIQEDFIDNKKIINEVAHYDKLDNLNIRPKGQIDGLHLNEEKIESILTTNNDLEDLAHIPPVKNLSSAFKNIQKHQSSFESTDENSYSRHQETNDNTTQTKKAQTHDTVTLRHIASFLRDMLDAHQTDTLPLHEVFSQTRDLYLENDTIHFIITDTLFVNSTSLANAAILALIVKELINPPYETLDDVLEPILNYSLKEIQHNNKNPLQILLIRALKKYLKKVLTEN